MADQSIINRAVQSADKYPEYRQLLNYLISSGGNVPLTVDDLEHGEKAAYMVPGYAEKRSKEPWIALDRFESAMSKPDRLAETLIHELTHAAQYRMDTQAEKGGNEQFTTAYNKLYGGENAKSQQGRPGPQLASKINKNFTSTESGYRSTPWELSAYGVGNSATKRTDYSAPPHIDATMATEFMILLDLAMRGLKK